MLCFQCGPQQHWQTALGRYAPYTNKPVWWYNRGESRILVSNFHPDPVCDGVSMTVHQALWQLHYSDSTDTLWLQRPCNVPFLIHKERILSPSIVSACLAMTNVILAQWDILCWDLTLNEKEGENKVKVRPSEFLLMYKSPRIRPKNAFGVPQYDLYSIFRLICYKV